MAHVELNNVNKYFGNFQAITDLSLDIEQGQFCALLGPSGCGKSTLLRLIAGLEAVSSGSISIAGDDVTQVHPAKRAIAMVFQSYALYPHMSVRENIAFSLEVARVSKADRNKKAEEIADLLQLTELLDRKPAELSGGQRQRVAIGRALVREPEAFLFDEPLSNLDAMLRVQMRLELSNLHQQLGTTMIYVTHDQVEAMTMADRIVVMNGGKISQVGAPLDLYNNPANRFVAGFIGSPSMNILSAKMSGENGQKLDIAIEGGSQDIATQAKNIHANADRDIIELGVRPEHIQLVNNDDKGANLSGKIALVERLGNSTLAHIATDAGQLAVQGDGEMNVNIGENVGLVLDVQKVHAFNAAGQVV